MLSRIAWSMPREQFSYMAQQLLEHVMVEFFGNAIEEFGIGSVALSGGIFSNVKANMQIRNIAELKKWFIFPHMGDGGIAMGAAMHVNYALNGVAEYDFPDAYLGDGFGDGRDRGRAEEGEGAPLRGGRRQVLARRGADKRRQLRLLVPGQDGVRPQGAGQQEHTRQGRVRERQGEAQHLRQAEGVVPAFRAVDARRGGGEDPRRDKGPRQVHDNGLQGQAREDRA